MPKELGDHVFPETETIPKTTDGSGSAGDAVKMNGSGKVTPVTTLGDEFYGILASDMSDKSDGDEVTVAIGGIVVANTTGSVTDGDYLEIDGATNGRLAVNSTGSHKSVDEGGTETYELVMRSPRARSDAGASDAYGASLGSNEALIDLP